MCGGDEFKVDSIGGLDISEFGLAALGWIRWFKLGGENFGWVNGIGDDNDSCLNHDFTIVWLKFLDRNSG